MEIPKFYDFEKQFRGTEKEEEPYSTPKTYRDYVQFLRSRNPYLANLVSFFSERRVSQRTCRITALDFHRGIQFPHVRNVPDADLLQRELRQLQDAKDPDPLHGRMLIVEDLTPEIIELLGSSLDIDPMFFALHIHTTLRGDMRFPAADDAILPSQLVSQNFMSTAYQRALFSDQEPPGTKKLVRDMEINRKLVFIRSTKIALAQHCASILKVQQSGGLWIALVLVDPPISDTCYPPGHKDEDTLKIHLSLQPFLGGPENFLDPPKFSSNWHHNDTSPRNGGIAAEIIHYWTRQIPASFSAQNPSLASLAYYPFRIVRGEWIKYISVMQHCIKFYEYHGDQVPTLDQFNTDLRELQKWRRRGMVSKQKVRSTIRQLKARVVPGQKGSDDIHHLIEDMEMISTDIKNAGKLLENMLPVVTSLVQITDARQSFVETSNIGRLTTLAIIFVPLSFVASLFSMNPENSPGGSLFWVYLVVAIPLTMVVFAIAKPPIENIETVSKTIEWLKNCFGKSRKRPVMPSRVDHWKTRSDSPA